MGVVDTATEVADVRADVVEAVVGAGDEMVLDVIEDTFSFDVAELIVSADESLPNNALSTSCALTIVMTASKESNTRKVWVRASMMSRVRDHSHKFLVYSRGESPLVVLSDQGLSERKCRRQDVS